MRSKQELDDLFLEWAYETLGNWQNEYSAWDVMAEQEALSEEELEYLMRRIRFEVGVCLDVEESE